MSGTRRFDQWDRDSQLYDTFVTGAETLLETDDQFQSARAEWKEFFTTSYGDVLNTLGTKNAEDRLFVDSLYFDFIVDQIMEFAERSFGFSVRNRDPRTNTDTLSFSLRSLHDRIIDSDAAADTFDGSFTKDDLRAADTEFLRKLYETIVSREIRLALGEYYTPRGVAELAVEALDTEDTAEASFLDPGCGSGVFISVCVDRKLERLRDDHGPEEVISNVTTSVVGIDLNPVAVKSTKLSYLLSLLPVLEEAEAQRVELPVFLTDALRLTRDEEIVFRDGSFEPTASHLVGNPPWITWDRLSENVKTQWREKYVDRLNLLPHDGTVSRLGHSNDDVSIPYLWVCVHHYLERGGQASFVLKRNVMRGPAGKLLRTLSVADRPLNLTHVHDLNELRPFGDQVGADAAIYTFSADARPTFPVEVTSWTRGNSTPEYTTSATVQDTVARERTSLVPLDRDDSTSAWVRRDAERGAL